MLSDFILLRGAGRCPLPEALVCLALVCLATACGEQESPAKVSDWTVERSAEQVPESRASEFRIDPRATSPSWLLERLRLPKPFGSEAAKVHADPAAFERIIAAFLRSRPPLLGFPHRMVLNNSKTIANYQVGLLQLGINSAVPFTLTPRWDQEELGANHLNQLHSLRFLSNFANEYHATGKEKYFDIIDRVLSDWLEHNPYNSPAHPQAWRRGTVDIRLPVLAYLLDRTGSVNLPRRVPLCVLLTMVHQHAELLLSDGIYVPNNNHGIRQDQALITAALVAPYFKRSAEWMRTALTRLRTQQIETGFSREGVWKEHSPAYHHYVMNTLLNGISRLVEKNGLLADAAFLQGLRAKSQRYLAHVLTPLGRFPPVGDSDEGTLSESLAETPELLYTLTGGAKGSPPETLDGFFPDAGEITFRDSWGRPDRPTAEAMYLHMHAALHGGVGLEHRHADELSFVLHALGRWWVLETGKYAYNPGPIRKHVKSAPAHNGVTFNGRGMEPEDWKDFSRTVSFEPVLVSTPELAAVRGTTSRFATGNARATRSFIFLRNQQTLLLLDHVQARTAGHWQWYFHLPPDAQVTQEGAAVRVAVASHPSMVLSIVTENTEPASAYVVKGQTDPLLGWYSPRYGAWEPAPVAVFERRGRKLTVATLIRLHGTSEKSPAAVRTEKRDGAYVVSWRDGNGKARSLRTPISGPLSIAAGE